MNAWLQGQAQKAQITEADVQRKKLGIVKQAEARNKAGMNATKACQLNETKKPKGSVSGEQADKFLKDQTAKIKKEGEKKGMTPKQIDKKVQEVLRSKEDDADVSAEDHT
jgi:ribosomal protein L22